MEQQSNNDSQQEPKQHVNTEKEGVSQNTSSNNKEDKKVPEDRDAGNLEHGELGGASGEEPNKKNS